jgi:Ni/Co efflux regulator RcnB
VQRKAGLTSPAPLRKEEEAQMALRATWRRIVLLLAATLVAAAMMTATATSAAFAGEKSEESCGASNPKIDEPSEKGKKGKEFDDCGFRNNPNEEKGFPPGQYE